MGAARPSGLTGPLEVAPFGRTEVAPLRRTGLAPLGRTQPGRGPTRGWLRLAELRAALIPRAATLAAARDRCKARDNPPVNQERRSSASAVVRQFTAGNHRSGVNPRSRPVVRDSWPRLPT